MGWEGAIGLPIKKVGFDGKKASTVMLKPF
jgi:hypothetical protein